jgi:uncharacterized delta-60 repeat protein
MALDSSGRIVVVGRSCETTWECLSVATRGTLIARFTSSGDLDTTFNSSGFMWEMNGYTWQSGGSTLSSGTTDNNIFRKVAIASDGKIIAGGMATVGGVQRGLIVRFNSNGSVDTTIGNTTSNGINFVRHPTQATYNMYMHAMALDASNNIYLGGRDDAGSGINVDGFVTLYKFLSNGTLDTAGFAGGNGFYRAPAHNTFVGANAASYERINAIAIEPGTGYIYVVGGGDRSVGCSSAGTMAAFPCEIYNHGDAFTARFTSVGALDATFGTGGIRDHDTGTSDFMGSNGYDFAEALTLDRNNKAIMVGITGTATTTMRGMVIRYTSTGTNDQ